MVRVKLANEYDLGVEIWIFAAISFSISCVVCFLIVLRYVKRPLLIGEKA
jgi:hypothetical protein